MKKNLLFVHIALMAIIFLPSVVLAQAEFDNTALDIVVNDYGRIRTYLTNGGAKQLERISPLVGGGVNQVFDYQNDSENESPSIVVGSSTFADFEIFGAYNNTYSNLPPNVKVEMNLYAWTGQSYFIVKYTITNNGTTTLNAIPGYEVIPEPDGYYGSDVTTYVAAQQAAITRNDSATTQVGTQVLSHDIASLKITSWFSDYWANDTNLYAWLTHGSIDQTGVADVDGALLIFGLPTVAIPAGGSFSYYLATAFGADQATVLNLLSAAQTQYNSTFTAIEENELPNGYNLSQNYPNPFNPTTKINFSIPQSSFVSMKVYNTLGQVVANLISEEMSVGQYTVDFNGADLSSGIYFVELTAGQYKNIKKMTLMK